jgi:ABC-2 type transport system ATP-binding protein
MGAAIETNDLTRSFASGLAVDSVTLSVQPGEVLALLGPNGAGKTTTVRLLNGVLRPDRGWARVAGQDPAIDGDAVRSRTGVLTENAGLDDRLTTLENLEYTARLRGFGPVDARKRSMDLLERFGIAGRAQDSTQGFSTGQRKRVALARALLHDPEVLFLDEPTSGLDPAGTRDVAELLTQLSSEGRTIVLATHFLGEAGRLADSMAVLHHGRLLAAGRPDDLAAELFDGIGGSLDLGRPAPPTLIAALAAVDGVHQVRPSVDGAELRIEDRDVVPRLVATAIDQELPVYGAAAHRPDLEDVYFAVESRIVAEQGSGATDGFLAPSRPAERSDDDTDGGDNPAWPTGGKR